MAEVTIHWKPTTIISGGQTGADRGGLIGAKRLGIKTDGWMPNGLRCDDDIGQQVQKEFGLREAQGGYRDRDRLNVQMCDAIMAFLLDIPKTGKGTTCTVRYATQGRYDFIPIEKKSQVMTIHGDKPALIIWDVSLDSIPKIVPEVHKFMNRYKPKVLCVSGSTASTKSDLESLVSDLLYHSFKGEEETTNPELNNEEFNKDSLC